MSSMLIGPVTHAVSTYRDPVLHGRRLEDCEVASTVTPMTSVAPFLRHGWPHLLHPLTARHLSAAPTAGGLR